MIRVSGRSDSAGAIDLQGTLSQWPTFSRFPRPIWRRFCAAASATTSFRPVGAINNGLELLDEGGADEDAMNLIRTSARNASARLQFARIAFGAAGSAGMLIDTGDAEAVATAFLQEREAGAGLERRAARCCRRTRSSCCST